MDNSTVRYSAAQLKVKRVRGESFTDLARVRAKTEAELEADIAGDEDFRDVPQDWYLAAEEVIPGVEKA